jgi:hypothetical protein
MRAVNQNQPRRSEEHEDGSQKPSWLISQGEGQNADNSKQERQLRFASDSLLRKTAQE